MECPFKRNIIKKIEYDFSRAEDRKPVKETTTTTFGECTFTCAFFNPFTEECKFKGSYPNIGGNT